MGMRVSVQGREHLPHHGGAILVSNHRSMIDGPLLYSLMNRTICFFAKSEYFSLPVLGWYLRKIGGIPVENGDLRLSIVKEVHDSLSHKEVLLVFPEGRINTDDSMLPFNPAFIKLAIRYGLPLIPITICGTERALPNAEWRWRPCRACVLVIVHNPIKLIRLEHKKEEIRFLTKRVFVTIWDAWKEVEGRRVTTRKIAALPQLMNWKKRNDLPRNDPRMV